jgi:hypothetical protein
MNEIVNELADTAVASSWTALFAAVWLSRHDLRGRIDPDADREHTRRRPRVERPRTRRRQPESIDQETATVVPSGRDELGATRRTSSLVVAECFDLDLSSPSPPRAGSRFDDTVAHPIDAPHRLDAVIRAAGLRLRALPDVKDLGHRTVAHRARLQQVMREAAQARARLAAGTYGMCLTCTGVISFARLSETPWARRCIYCELDI